MRIERLSTAVLSANYDWFLVRLDSDSGHSGLGEGYVGPGVSAVLREYTPLLLGQDPTNVEPLMRRLRGAALHASPGVADHALAAIETALLDLTGKVYQMPVWRLLGGQYRRRIRIYADCHAGDALDSITPLLQARPAPWLNEPSGPAAAISLKHHGWDPSQPDFPAVEDYRRRARDMAAMGFTALKFDADIPTPYAGDEFNRTLTHAEIEYVTERLAAIRQEVGNQVDLAVDCHWNYAVPDAIRLARALEPLHPLWMEDPVPPSPIAPLAEVQAATTIPISTGENVYRPEEFADLLTAGHVRILAPDVQKVGPLRAKQIAQIADLAFVNLAFHNIASPIGLAAAAHVAAAVPNFLALEWHGASVPFYSELGSRPLIQDGFITLDGAPGLGIDLNYEVARAHRRPGEPFFDD